MTPKAVRDSVSTKCTQATAARHDDPEFALFALQETKRALSHLRQTDPICVQLLSPDLQEVFAFVRLSLGADALQLETAAGKKINIGSLEDIFQSGSATELIADLLVKFKKVMSLER